MSNSSEGFNISSGPSSAPPQSHESANDLNELRKAAEIFRQYFTTHDKEIKEFINEFTDELVQNRMGSAKERSRAETGSYQRSPKHVVQIHTVTTGETFGADEALLSQVKNCEQLLVEKTDQRGCRVIILFCPITSRVGSDVDMAMSRMSGPKNIILVLMHHTRKLNYSTSGIKWSDKFPNVVLDVHVLFHESVPGLLTCPKNKEAVHLMQNILLQYSSAISCESQSQPKKRWLPFGF